METRVTTGSARLESETSLQIAREHTCEEEHDRSSESDLVDSQKGRCAQTWWRVPGFGDAVFEECGSMSLWTECDKDADHGVEEGHHTEVPPVGFGGQRGPKIAGRGRTGIRRELE